MMDANTDTIDPHFKAFIADTALHDVVGHYFLVVITKTLMLMGEKELIVY